MSELQDGTAQQPSASSWRTWSRQFGRRFPSLPLWAFWYGCFVLVSYGATRDLQTRTRAHVSQGLTLTASIVSALCILALFVTGVSLSKSHRIRRGHLRRSLGAHIIAGTVLWPLFALGRLVFDRVGVQSMGKEYSNLQDFLATFAVYAVWVAGIHCVTYARESRRAEARAFQLKVELSEAARQRMEAELRALKSELNPRFLTEACDTISTLIRVAPDRAENAVAQLGGVVRTALHRGSAREVTLLEELDTLQPFIELERARLGGTLQVDVRADEGVLDALVPDMVLQPLVSMALEGQGETGVMPRLAIAAARDASKPTSVAITVTGSGTQVFDEPAPHPDRAPAWQTTLRWRLAQMYGERSSLSVSRTPPPHTGSVGQLIIPYHEVEQLVPAMELSALPAAPSTLRRELLRALGVIAASTLWYNFIISSAKSQMMERVHGPEMPPHFFAMQVSLSALVYSLTMLVAIEMNRGVSWSDHTIPTGRKLLLHAGAVLGMCVLLVALKASVSLPYGIVADHSARHIAWLSWKTAYSALFVYSLTAGADYLIDGVRRRLRADRNELRLKAEMNESVRRRAEAELRALQAELNPHFVGNALHAVAGLIHSSPDQAVHVLGQLCQVLRAPFTRSGAPEVSLAEELAMLQPYLEVERARIRRPLPVRWNVEQEALRGRVPQMILQPLVENAVKHGLANHAANGAAGIEVFARRNGGLLEIAVSDDGCGVAPPPRSGQTARRGPQMGVANTRARLRELYGDRASFELASRAEGGTVARISVPWHEEPIALAAVTYKEPVHELVPA